MAATPEDLEDYLRTLGIAFRTVEHVPLFTVEESQALRGAIPGIHTKNLFVKDKKGVLFLIVAPEEAVIDLKHLHGRIGASGRLSFGSADQLYEVLGVTPGSVTVFGLMNDRTGKVTAVLDARLVAADAVNGHPLINTRTTTISGADMLKFVRATGHEPVVLALEASAAKSGLSEGQAPSLGTSEVAG